MRCAARRRHLSARAEDALVPAAGRRGGGPHVLPGPHGPQGLRELDRHAARRGSFVSVVQVSFKGFSAKIRALLVKKWYDVFHAKYYHWPITHR